MDLRHDAGLRVGFIGGGNMCEAILANLVRTATVKASRIHVAELSDERRAYLVEQYGVQVTADGSSVVASSDVVILSVKPQVMTSVLTAVKGAFDGRQLVISIAAGKSLAGIAELLPENVPLVRVMPNLPAQVSEGVSAFCCGPHVSTFHRAVAECLLGCFGEVVAVPEEQFDAVTALSGSGPAFFAYYAEQMVQGAVKLGFKYEDAMVLTLQTMLGTAKLLKSDGRSPAELIDAVCSEGGTTEAGMKALYASDIHEAVASTLKAAADRSAELSG